MTLKLPISIVSCLVLLITLAASATAQQRRQPPARPQPAPAPTPPPTLDTLLAADTYRLYGEVRSVGQFIKSNSVNEILEPILTLAGPSNEFRRIIKWLNLHADEVTSSRMIVAAWPAVPGSFPEMVVAIEFASPEDANKFQQQLHLFLQKMTAPATSKEGEASKPAPASPPPYYIQQAGSLVVITPKFVNLKQLRPAGKKLLAEDANFRVAHNRLNTEALFVYFDVGGVEKEDQERIAKAEEERQKAVAEKAANPEPPEEPKVEVQTELDETEVSRPPEVFGVVADTKGANANSPQATTPPPILMALTTLMSNLTGVESNWPDAFAVGLSLEGESFDLRALLVNAPGEKSDPIPFLPVIVPGPAITPEAPSVLPGDTEMLVTMSLDLPQIYTTFSTPKPSYLVTRGQNNVPQSNELDSPFAAVEKELKIKIKDDLLPLIGSEIAVSIPMSGAGLFQPPQPPKAEPPSTSRPSPSPSPEASPNANATDNFTLTETTQNVDVSFVIAISLKDKEGMRALLPKLIENIAFKGASALAQTERREDTELVSYANVISYAFIGNFLVISPEVQATRHVVDSYLKHQTLSGDPAFKNYTRWQSRQVQGQVYISPSLMESYKEWIQQPNAQIDDQTRAFLTKFSVVAQPVTYSLSNEGFGPLHELHVPKNLVLLLVAAASGVRPPTGELETPPPTPPPPPARPNP